MWRGTTNVEVKARMERVREDQLRRKGETDEGIYTGFGRFVSLRPDLETVNLNLDLTFKQTIPYSITFETSDIRFDSHSNTESKDEARREVRSSVAR